MPAYDYLCPANGRTVEVQHSMTTQVLTWGQLCSVAGALPGKTAATSPVKRIFSAPMIVNASGADTETACEIDSGEACHPGGCACYN